MHLNRPLLPPWCTLAGRQIQEQRQDLGSSTLTQDVGMPSSILTVRPTYTDFSLGQNSIIYLCNCYLISLGIMFKYVRTTHHG